jgi:hypothetical protein
MTELNWMGLTEAEVNAGLVQRGVVTMNFATGEPNKERRTARRPRSRC